MFMCFLPNFKMGGKYISIESTAPYNFLPLELFYFPPFLYYTMSTASFLHFLKSRGNPWVAAVRSFCPSGTDSLLLCEPNNVMKQIILFFLISWSIDPLVDLHSVIIYVNIPMSNFSKIRKIRLHKWERCSISKCLRRHRAQQMDKRSGLRTDLQDQMELSNLLTCEHSPPYALCPHKRTCLAIWGKIVLSAVTPQPASAAE